MRTFSLLALISLLQVAHAQDKGPNFTEPGKFYSSASGEWIFSVPLLDVNGSENGAVVRFSPFFNAQWMLNYDLSSHVGLYTGLDIRNQGFIYQTQDSTNTRYKYRTYNVGIPIGFKLGHMNQTLFFAGYEVELPFNYKEKRFENERKVDKFNVWFSDRNSPVYQSVFAGIQGPDGVTLTVRYYLTNFHNEDFTETVTNNGVTTNQQPYKGMKVNILAFSLGYSLFDGRMVKRSSAKATHDIQSMR
ncbi:MAG: hypothetical protein ABI373_05095 [Flavobacteriales bacterium]